ncbi:MAG: acyl--CoA ligase [Lachnospiraceae bacterium]|nr:acyl--CoA ligase [Lachnospiraceae bacterium]
MQQNKGYPSKDRPWMQWYNGQTADDEVLNRTVWENVFQGNKDHDDEIALVYQNVKITYKTLFDRTEEVANALVGNGIRKGDRIIICATGTPETVYILLACSKVGICAEMINLSLGRDAIESALMESKAQYIFCLDKIYLKLQNLFEQTEKKIVVIPVTYSLPLVLQVFLKIINKEKFDLHKVIRWKDFLLNSTEKFDDNTNSESELVIVFSSGSTGKSKAIVHTNHSYTTISEEYRICEYPFKRNDVFLNQIPFFIASGLSFMLMAPLMLGITVILEPEYEPKKWVDDISKYKPEVICATKGFWDVAIHEKLFVGKDLSHLNIAVQGGEPNTEKMEKEINELLKTCGCKNQIVVGYGMSELNGTLTTSSFKHHTLGSTGIPLPDVIVSAFDTNTGIESPINERGELMAMSPCTMKEYADNIELTEKFKWRDASGRLWYRTGDVGYVDEFGEVYVLGRALDVVEVSNKKIYLFDIEKEIIDRANVSSCKVVVDDAATIFINIISDDDESVDEVNNIIEKHLPPNTKFKVKAWKEFPINANGKCDREALKVE